MEGEAKENDLRPISDRISGAIRRFLLEDLRDRRGMYGAIKSLIINEVWMQEMDSSEVCSMNEVDSSTVCMK